MMPAEYQLRRCHAGRMEDRILKHQSSFDRGLAAVRSNPRAESVVELFGYAVRRYRYTGRRVSQVRVSESRQQNGCFRLNLKVPLMDYLSAPFDLRKPLIQVPEERHHLRCLQNVRHCGR